MQFSMIIMRKNGKGAFAMFTGTIWAVVPPLVAIALALITKQVYLSLFAGVFHGTGDVFASACVGALMRGLSLENSLKTAANYTVDSIKKTVAEPNHNTYGVNFEQSVPLLLEELEKNK